MKLSRLLREAKAVTNLLFWGKADRKKLNKNLIVIATGAAISFCGLFYSLWSFLPQELNFSLVDPAHAQEVSEADPWTEEDVKEIICAKPTANATVADPSLAIFKLDQLCEELQAENPTEEPMAAVDEEQERLKEIITPILTGTPMEPMIEPISQQEKIVAAFLVGISLKESQFGKHSPKKQGRDCFNYWGYKGGYNPTAGGYSCFDSHEHAVEVVGARLHKFSVDQSRNTPSKMLIWKCGSSCNGHSKNGVQKWVSDVSIYFNKINQS